MNKKLVIGISVIVGGVLMAATALASGSGSTGYDVYKTAFKNTRAATSMTGTAAFTVADNGKVIVQSNGTVKMNQNTKAMSGVLNVTFDGQTKTMTVYRQDDQTVTKSSDSDVYNVLAFEPGKHKGAKEWGHGHQNPALAKDMENIVDLLVGNYQNYISLDSKGEGMKEVSLALSDSQISPLVNAVASLAVRERALESEKNRHPSDPFASAIHDQLPKLVDQIRVTSVDVKADIDDQNFIREQTADITLTGKDAAGQDHEVVVSVDLNLSNINSTTPDSIDLTGKSVKTIQPEDVEQFCHRR